MKTARQFRTLFLVLAACLLAGAAPAQTAAVGMAARANAFLATLDAGERQAVLFSYGDARQRQHWSNLPTGAVPRSGIRLGDMTAPQRAALMSLLSTALSAKGYRKVQEIMEGDERLNTGFRARTMFGKDLYYVSILGMPSDTSPWLLQFGGHHLALNITVSGQDGVLTPSLTGAQPGLYTVGAQTVRPLGLESDKAAALFNSLSPAQRNKAILPSRVADLVLGPGQDGKTIIPEGLQATFMNESQRALLLDVIGEWAGIIRDDLAAARMREIRAGLDDTWFAWSGPETPTPGSNITAYYRIQGPKLVIEYSPQGRDPMHIHTIYRDPTNDYGRALAAR